MYKYINCAYILYSFFLILQRIPEAFVKYFDGEVPNSSVLWGPSNSRKTWRVDLKEVGNNLFFQKGWSAFVQDNSLKMGDFLLFRYDGSSNFSVKIYGIDCCEKGVAGASRTSYTPVYGNGKEEKEKMRNYLKRKSEQLLVGTGENDEKKKRGYHKKMKRERLLVSTGTNEVDTKEIEVIYIDSDASDDNIGKPDLHSQIRSKNKLNISFLKQLLRCFRNLTFMLLYFWCRQVYEVNTKRENRYRGYSKAFVL